MGCNEKLIRIKSRIGDNGAAKKNCLICNLQVTVNLAGRWKKGEGIDVKLGNISQTDFRRTVPQLVIILVRFHKITLKSTGGWGLNMKIFSTRISIHDT